MPKTNKFEEDYVFVPIHQLKPGSHVPGTHCVPANLVSRVVNSIKALKDPIKTEPTSIEVDLYIKEKGSCDPSLPSETTCNQTQLDFQNKLHQIVLAVEHLLCHKNANYGNASFEPLRIFDKSGVDTKLSRIDEKLARIKASDKLRKSDWADLLGYLILEGIEQEWFDLTDLLN